MMAVKMERWWKISAERTAMVDILLKANADLNTQENVRLQYQNMYSNLMQLSHTQLLSLFITEHWLDSTNVCCG